MLTPNQFIERWQAEVVAKSTLPEHDQLVTVPSHRVAEFPLLPEMAQQFLATAGLPKSCAPCLTFDELADGLRHLWDVFSPTQWKQEEKQWLEHYALIGSDGAGNPICIDERDGRVVLIDHELLFDPKYRERSTTFVNSSVAQLAESILFVNTLRSSARLNAIKHIDGPAVAKGTFWYCEATDLPDETGDQEMKTKPWWKFW